MSILTVILILAAIGFVLWLINAKLPMEPTIKTILNAAVVILVVLWLLRVTGLFDGMAGVRV